ncbi:uncharacterized protein LOC129602286 [Paramacrobiotus metropolitanus]|uniref:uncharacterized protein LOC129602286 n=1 Tax=Paramacrobiotus metropolitanus TaxID=2943436 RepID=UPI0024463959|nr:uncharacterized protein LOC129602286 [Paramacrobiotus metropolitanus]XP_055357260.1 uncharacterized protein LOC129602286 [Paramacrobiotus metropolitanus]
MEILEISQLDRAEKKSVEQIKDHMKSSYNSLVRMKMRLEQTKAKLDAIEHDLGKTAPMQQDRVDNETSSVGCNTFIRWIRRTICQALESEGRRNQQLILEVSNVLIISADERLKITNDLNIVGIQIHNDARWLTLAHVRIRILLSETSTLDSTTMVNWFETFSGSIKELMIEQAAQEERVRKLIRGN